MRRLLIALVAILLIPLTTFADEYRVEYFYTSSELACLTAPHGNGGFWLGPASIATSGYVR